MRCQKGTTALLGISAGNLLIFLQLSLIYVESRVWFLLTNSIQAWKGPESVHYYHGQFFITGLVDKQICQRKSFMAPYNQLERGIGSGERIFRTRPKNPATLHSVSSGTAG